MKTRLQSRRRGSNTVHRKTGITLEDTGERDEYGMEPLENLFSSPEKDTNGRAPPPIFSDEEEEDMEIDDGMFAQAEPGQPKLTSRSFYPGARDSGSHETSETVDP